MLLKPEEIQAQLDQEIQDWSYETKANDSKQNFDYLRKTFKFKKFLEGIDFVHQIALLAEKADHHPDILIEYNKVTLTLSTHSDGGITQKDIDLASQINKGSF
jgi:4a-hydroxytetrahydrobiopterin dehydratase